MTIISSYPQTRYIAPVHSPDRFTFSDGAFIAELSDFNGQSLDGQLYDDACDVGFLIENPATGQAVPFLRSRNESSDGELVAIRCAQRRAVAIRVWPICAL